MSPTSPLSRPSSLINDLKSNTLPHSVQIPSTLPDHASASASVPSPSSADAAFLESDCPNLVTLGFLSASSLVALHSTSIPSINASGSTSIPSASSTQLGTRASKDRTPAPLQPQSQSRGFGNSSGTIRSALLSTNTHQTLIKPFSPPSSASSCTTAHSPLSSQPPVISPPLPASKSVSTSLSPPKPRRDFLGLDLHLGPLRPRNSILQSSSSGSKSGTSFFASRSNKSKKSYKFISTSPTSPRPSTASSTLSGSLQLRGSHHRFSFQPPSRPSAEQGAVSSLRSIPHTLPSPQVVVSPIQTTAKEACEETSVRSPQVQSIYHPFASPASASSTTHLSSSQSAPHISSLTRLFSGPPRTQTLAKLPSPPSPTPGGRASTKAVSGKGIQSSFSTGNLGFAYHATEVCGPSAELARNASNPGSQTLNSKMRAIFSRKSSLPTSASTMTSGPSQHSHASKPIVIPTQTNQPKPSEAGLGSSAFVDDDDGGELCPVCLEDLSMRLKGEKPHVVPSCGHNLHASCFEAVYGNISEARKTGQILGLCGVCRRDMRLGDMVSGGPAPRTTPLAMRSALMGTATSMSDSMTGKSKTNKFAAMAGLDAPQSICHKTNSASLKAMLAAGGTAPTFTDESSPVAEAFGHNPNDDDELSEDPSTAWSDPTHHPFRKQTTQIIKPVIRAISESPSLSPHTDHGRAQHFTCMVSVEVPAKYPPAVLHPPASATFPSGLSPVYLPSQPGSVSSPGSPLSQPTLPRVVSLGESESEMPSRSPEYGRVFQKVKSFPTPTSAPPSVRSGKGPENERPQGSNLLQSIVEDLLNRIQDWKGHSPSDFGNLRLHDRLQVRKEVNSRDFLVYLFDEALLCVAEDQQRPVSGSSVSRSGRRVPSRSRLRLKGRVYIRHMSAVVNSSTDAAPMLTIKMQDDNLEAFVMRFNDRAQLESWQTTIQQLIDQHFPDRARLEGRMPLPPIPTTTAASFDAQLSGAALEGRPATAPSSDGGYASSSFTGYTKATAFTSAPTLFSVGEEDDESLVGSHAMSVDRRPHRTSFASRHQHSHLESLTEPIPTSARSPMSAQSSTEPYSPMAFNPAIGPFVPEDLPPIDLILMISIPSPANLSAAAVMPSSTKLKLRLLKESLTFVIGHLHPRSRISLVVYSVSVDDETNGRGQLKKTPFLAVGREAGRRRLEFVIDQIRRGGDCLGMVNRHNEGYYAEVAPAYQRHRAGELGSPSTADYRVLEECLRMTEIEEERVSVVTAVNLAYDNILQRKQKNPLTGILLMHDTHDSSTKPQMALVMTRAEAANVPIHTIGWGKAHNPSCLWQLSNHTGGTYTFVKDLYSIKDTFTGCIGGMLSVGATNANLQLSVPEHRWFKIKKISGVLSFVLSSDGQHADIELGELRYGERRDILVEMEMSGSGPGGDRGVDELSRSVGGRIEGNQVFTGTDAFFIQNGAGLKELGVGGAVDFYQAEFEQLSEDVPLLEVDASYRDPIAGKSVRRLVRPVLLSVTIGPTGPGRLGAGSEPGIVRRRIELLTSDSLTRALLLISRRMDRQAARLLDETRRIVSTVLRNMSGEEKPRSRSLGGIGRPTRNAQEQALAKDVLMGCLADLETLLVGVEDLVRVLGEGLEGVADVDVRRADQRAAAAYQHFEALERNLGAQQAVVLRDQRAWTGRTLTERNFWKADLSMLYYMRCMHSSV